MSHWCLIQTGRCVPLILHKFPVSGSDSSIPLLFILTVIWSSYVLPYPLLLLYLSCIKAVGIVLYALLLFVELRKCHGVEIEQSHLVFVLFCFVLFRDIEVPYKHLPILKIILTNDGEQCRKYIHHYSELATS